jgi:hypothetical protein
MRIAYYGFHWFDSSAVEYERTDPETLAAALAIAKKKVKAQGGSAHAVITDGARLAATVVLNRGRLQVLKR